MFTVAANMEAGAPFFARRSLLSQSVIKIETYKNRIFYSFHEEYTYQIIGRKIGKIYLGQLAQTIA